jgi:hypothetical protein
MQQRFTATSFLILGGLLVWMADFVFVYGFAAVACAKGLADASLVGLPVVTVVTLLASLLAGVITALIARRGYCLHRSREMDEHTRFIGFVAAASGGLALVALLLLLLPSLLMSACAMP